VASNNAGWPSATSRFCAGKQAKNLNFVQRLFIQGFVQTLSQEVQIKCQAQSTKKI